MNDQSNSKPIREVLESLNKKDRETFLACRGLMRRAYLQCLASTLGMHKYSHEDDTFLDALDIKLEMLMARAAIPTNINANTKPESYVHDPFALITRPQEETPVASTEGNPNVNVVEGIAKDISLVEKVKDRANQPVGVQPIAPWPTKNSVK